MLRDYNIIRTSTKMGIVILVNSRLCYLTSVLGTEHNHTDQFFWKDQIIGDHDKYDASPSGHTV
jgi:hypothetical protein